LTLDKKDGKMEKKRSEGKKMAIHAAEIELSEKERQILSEYSKSRTVGENMRSRSEIIMKASEGKSNNEIEREMGITGKKVTRWRNRYSEKREMIRRTEMESPHKMRRLIEEILTDEYRSGAPMKYTAEQVGMILALACEDPMEIGLPFSHWSPGLLRIESIKRGIVEEISKRQVGRFLKHGGITAAPESVLAEPQDRRLRAVSG